MAHIVSYMWMLSHQGADVYEGISFGILGAGVLLLVQACHWAWALSSRLVSPSLCVDKEVVFSYCSSIMSNIISLPCSLSW